MRRVRCRRRHRPVNRGMRFPSPWWGMPRSSRRIYYCTDRIRSSKERPPPPLAPLVIIIKVLLLRPVDTTESPTTTLLADHSRRARQEAAAVAVRDVAVRG